MVSSEGSTPSAGAGFVEHGSGSDDESAPDPTRSVQTPPDAIVRSSGGALTPGAYDTSGADDEASGQHTADQRSESEDSSSQQSTTPTTAEATPTTATAPVAQPSQPVPDALAPSPINRPARNAAGPLNAPPSIRRAPRMSAIPDLPENRPVGIDSDRPPPTADVGHEGLSLRTDSVAGTDSDPPLATMRIVTSVLAAALVPFAVPVPGGPMQEPALWAVFAWVRRQSEHDAAGRRIGTLPATQHAEEVDEPAAAAKATVGRVDRVTGRVTGGVSIADEPDGLTYALLRQIDRRLGTVTVDAASGEWTFTPDHRSRLAAHVSPTADVAEFSIVASDGTTVDVTAPVAPAEAAMTDTIDVGAGLTYGLAVVGDRLYVLNSSYDEGGNGFVKMIDTSTKALAGSIEVGSMPFALAVSDRTLYVGNAGDGTVSVVDVATNRVVGVIDVGTMPYGLEVTDDRLYVADHAGTVSVIDLDDNTELTRLAIEGDPFGVVATADRIYVTNYAGGTVATFDQATNAAYATIEDTNPVGVTGYPYFAAVVGGRLYVVNSATNALTVIDRSVNTVVDVDPVTRAIDSIPRGAAPADIIVRGDRLYVSNVNCGTVTVIDVATNQPVETIRVGIQPGLMTATPDGRTIYVADVMDGTVRVITSVHPAAYGSGG
ncbi:MAG: PQQ-binding-like beta-propeller repeat protein [Mycobacterium sp.]